MCEEGSGLPCSVKSCDLEQWVSGVGTRDPSGQLCVLAVGRGVDVARETLLRYRDTFALGWGCREKRSMAFCMAPLPYLVSGPVTTHFLPSL